MLNPLEVFQQEYFIFGDMALSEEICEHLLFAQVFRIIFFKAENQMNLLESPKVFFPNALTTEYSPSIPKGFPKEKIPSNPFPILLHITTFLP